MSRYTEDRLRRLHFQKWLLVMCLILLLRYLFVFFCRGWARLGRAVRGWDLALVFWNIKDGQGFRGGRSSDISTTTDRGSSKIKKIGAYG
ncbi:hypothetical protein BDDG_12893 [Blastomyces dermatitidis ATCC 18188]|uniref:Uncharacterized protein n=1 Tax=Ajellomyces dermatitidis (strain ATCC 18188 / CBS 674.68) TaxID=653446 RepID=A0A0J9ERB4_AJEDA|nr:hypothetical protein BDDG_12893 [Blastomyces dermatitidis ATCC 18188]